MQKPQILVAGQLIGGCRIVQPLGRGGMGEVYLAEHLALQKPVAVKILPPDRGARDHVARFLKEARMCSRIEHPNVVTIYDVGEQDGLHYIIMQYVQGKTLAELVQAQGGPLPWRSALRLVQLAAKGLQAVHDHGLIHRDVKPSNIMLSADSRVLLMDFGLVREEIDPNTTDPSLIAGTPAYMSPEQCEGRPLDRRSDVFSLGSTLYCLLTGHSPFQGTVP
jgi:serine/threonine-protein kinase